MPALPRGSIAASLLVWFLCSLTAFAQSPDLDKAKKLFAAGKRSEAKQLLDRITKGKNPPAEAHSILGLILMDPPFSKNRLAAVEFQKAMVIDPRDLHGNLGAGIVLYRSQQYRQALSFLRKAYSLAPRYPDVNLYLGKLHYATSDYSRALEAFGRAKDHPEAIEYIAIIESRRQRPLAAAKLITGLLEKYGKDSPQRPRLLYQRAAFLVMGAKLKEAEPALLEAIEAGFKRAEAYNELARLAYERDELPVARKLYKEALAAPSVKGVQEAKGPRAASHFALGLIEFRERDFSAALVHLESAIRVDPFHPNAWYKLGQVLQRLKRKDDAKKAFARHKTLEPLHQKLRSVKLSLVNDPSSRKNRLAYGLLLNSLGQPEAALTQLLILEQEDPEHSGLALALADVAKSLGNAVMEKKYRDKASPDSQPHEESK